MSCSPVEISTPRFGRCVGLIALLVVLLSAIGQAQEASVDLLDRRGSVDLAPQPLAQVVIQLWQDYHVHVSVPSQLGNSLRSPELHGTFTLRELLDRLLSGSGLRYQVLDEETITLGRPPAPAPIAHHTNTNTGSGTDAGNTGALSEVRVTASTGTNLLLFEPTWSPRLIYDRAEIEQSGATTLGDFVRNITSNYPSTNPVAAIFANTAGAVPQSVDNPFFASGINLHGLGPGTSLCLVDGWRWAGAGSSGTLCDLDFIPINAIENGVVVPDGDSAVYGADAVSGVANFVLREKFDGAETAASLDGTSRGGGRTEMLAETLGKTWDAGGILLAYQYRKQDEILSTERDFIPAISPPLAIVPEQKISSAILKVSQQVAESTTLELTGLWGIRDFTDSSGGFAGYRLARNGTVKELSQTVALEHEPTTGWSIGTFATYSRLDQSLVTSAPATQSFQFEPGGSLLGEVGVKVNGTPFELPGGQIETAIGAGAREEKLTVSASEYADTYVSEKRSSRDFYVEVHVPVVGDSNAITAIQRLDLSAAVRYDHYADFGSTYNPRGGITWSPLTEVNIRATAARSFKPPALNDGVAIPYYYTDSIAEHGATGPKTDTLINGSQGLEPLEPETAYTVTMGIDFRPNQKEGFRGSLTGFGTLFDNRIAAPPVLGSLANGVDIFSQPALSPYISRSVNPAWVRTIFGAPGFAGDGANLGPSGVTAYFNDELTNIARSEEAGLDTIARYTRDTVTGTFEASYLLRDTYRSAAGAPTVNILDTLGQPSRFRARVSVAWSPQWWSLSLSVNYTSASQDTLVVPSEKIDSWTTFDLHMSYSIPAHIALVRCLKMSLSVSNVLNTRPSYVNIPAGLPYRDVGFDAMSGSPEGRWVSAGLSCLR